MAGPIEESVDFFLKQVRENDTLTEEQKRDFYERAVRSLADKITDGTHRWGMSMVVGKWGQEAGQKHKKARKATAEKINGLLAELRKSSLTDEQALIYVCHVFRESLTKPVDKVVSEYLENAVKGDFRYASGLCGHMAKHAVEQREAAQQSRTSKE